MEQQRKWTPGPWVIGEWTPTGVEDGKRRNICSTGGYSDNRDTAKTNEQNVANANLIAAAPELYEALEKLLDFVEAHTESGEVIPPYTVEHVRTRAALAKARGEPTTC